MHDLRWLVENSDEMKRHLTMRKDDTSLVDQVVEKDVIRKELIETEESLRSKRNALAKEIGQKKRNKENADDLMAESKQINDQLDSLGSSLHDAQEEIRAILLKIPNILHKDVPEGSDEADNKLLHKNGEPKQFSFPVKDHHDLGTELGILDFERSARISGARFNTLRGKGARLNRALAQFMLDLHTEEHGYEEFMPPIVLNAKALEGTGQLPKFAEDQFYISEDKYYLNPTAEVPLTNFHREEILQASDLPLKFTAYTHCFRREAGNYGRDTRGLIRQHQFEKVELVNLVHPEESEGAHEKMREAAEKVLQLLELPYKTMILCSGDIGFCAAKCYDLEVWLPSQNKYREISSVSNCLDYQARRANIRFRDGQKGKPQFVHTLNGSGLAIGRTLLAILENYQQEDGSILIPKVLQKYTQFDHISA